MGSKKVVVIGAGPAGLTAALDLSKKNVGVEVFEAENMVGGISKTINYNGYYFDQGGHRFFSKYDEVNSLWNEVLGDEFIETPRLSRIFYKNKFFDYPLKPANALLNMGIVDTATVLYSYLNSKFFPIKEENSFEDWVTNRFGKKLYSMFFKTYTEKVWGTPCSNIGADWAAQRIKGLSLYTAVYNAVFKPKNNNIKTLIDQFMYPKYGPGMMYKKMAGMIEENGGRIRKNCKVVSIERDKFNVKTIKYINENNEENTVEAEEFISSMPLNELVMIMKPSLDEIIVDAAKMLKYRSLINVDIIVDKENCFPDNWIYIHSPDVKLGRIQNFKNWSRYMVKDRTKTSLGLEYFCTEGDELWSMKDEALIDLALSEVEKVGLAEKGKVEGGIVVRIPKAYPVYFTGYQKYVNIIKNEIKRFNNLQPVGRYGMYRYNNMDHSIMTGLYAANNILYEEKKDVWSINTEPEYHEIKKEVTGKKFEMPVPKRS